MNDAGNYQALKARVRRELDKPQVRHNFRQAMDGIRARRAEQFAEPGCFEALREQARGIRQQALDELPELLHQLEQQLEGNGIRVHHAADAAEANALILDLLQQAGARSVIKGKSMVSEETALNQALGDAGIEVIESDLGEYIIQLAHEPPSHIVAPAIHKNRREVAELFRDHHPELEYTEDIDRLTGNARQVLRERFARADAGISGVNFAVAETGTLVLVENEGNGRLSTTAPPLHIAITGIEKVIERLDQIPPLLEILTKSATGQPITTYVNFINRPRQPDELDGPREVHLVLLDNGRSRIREDPALAETLRCIRCGACINHCPVYVQVGGHAYGSVYPGPIGSVLEPQRLGLTEMGSLTSACTLCGACGDICPVQIPLPELINRLRAEAVEPGHDARVPGAGALRKPTEAVAWQLWKTLYAQPGLYRGFTWLATRLRRLAPSRLGPWTRYRTAPKPAARTLHELAKRQGIPAQARPSPRHELPARHKPDTDQPVTRQDLCGDQEACIDRFITRQQAVRGEVHRLRDRNWLNWLAQELPRRNVNTLLHGCGAIGHRLREHLSDSLALRAYDQPVEAWKDALFHHVDAAITGCLGAVAETGSLILWPDREEPRLMSLVPPLHIVLLEADAIHPSLSDAMAAQHWAEGIPTNALLISGPSKTADIEQTLAYGIHGPKALVTLILG